MLPISNSDGLLPLVDSAAQEGEKDEIELILSALKDVKSKSGYGNIHVIIYAGAVLEVETVVKRKTKKGLTGKKG
jgi:hypothetical protein